MLAPRQVCGAGRAVQLSFVSLPALLLALGFLTALVGAALPSSATAAGAPTSAAAAPPAITAAPATPTPAPFRTAVLDNGLTVLLSPSAAHPVIAVSCFVTTGGRTEDAYYQGSLHYIEHLVFKGGTPHLPPTQFRKRISFLGREAGGWTWDDEINFGFEVPEEASHEALGVFREALLDLQFEPEWFEDEKRVVLQEMTRGREEPRELIDEAWLATAYNVHPYRRPVIGSEKAIRELDMQKTFAYYKQRFTPNHMILSVAGDFDEAAMLAAIEEQWGGLEPGPASFELGLEEPEQRGPRTRTDFLPQVTTGMLLLGVVAPGGAHADTPALEMLAALLDDDSFGLPQYLVEQEKWVSEVSAHDYVKRDASDFQVFARAEPERLAAVTDFVRDFVLRFDATAIPPAVFEQTRQRLLFREAERRATAAGRAGRFGFLVSRRGLAEARALTERYRALTPAAVQAAKERWLTPRRLVIASVLPDDFDPAAAPAAAVNPQPPLAPPPPDLEVPGALLPPGDAAAPLAYTKTDAADGVSLYTYANGLRLLVEPVAGAPLTAVSGRVLGGQWVEPAGKEGQNLFVAEAGLRGTRRWDREGFHRLLAAHSLTASAHLGVGSRANTSRHVDYRDAGAHHYRGLAAEWPAMLAALKETLFFPSFDAREVGKLRDDLTTRARQLRENNLEFIKQAFYERAYAGHPYGRPTFGSETSLAGITAAELRAFHDSTWTPDRTVISVAGDVEPDTVAAWIASRWADLAAPGAPAASAAPGDPAAPGDLPSPGTPATEPWTLDPHAWPLDWQPPAEQQVLALGKDYWTVNWGRPGAVADDPDAWTSVVLGSVAGNDHFYKYVYREGVSYRSWIRFWRHLGPGAWIIENDVKRDRFDEILAKFDEDLRRYSTAGFSEQQVTEAVQRLVNASILDRQDNARTAWRLAVAEGNGTGFRQVTGEVAALRAVTYADAQALAKKIFQPQHMLRLVQE